MDKNNVIELESGGFVADPLSELIREGAWAITTLSPALRLPN